MISRFMLYSELPQTILQRYSVPEFQRQVTKRHSMISYGSDPVAMVDEVLSVTIVTSILIPVLLLLLRTLLGQELSYWGSFFSCYFNRPFDIDGDPTTHDWAMIFNVASGEWECCSLTFHFGIRKRGNGAFIHHYDDEWNLHFIERIPFGRWKEVGKGRLGDVALVDGLDEKIRDMRDGAGVSVQ